MNADILPMNTSKYEKPEEEKPNARICGHDNSNHLQAARDVPESRPVVENSSQSAERKRKSSPNATQASHASPLSTKDIYSTTGKHQVYKLVDSKQVSKPSSHQSDKRTFLLDTYARIVASNNKRCSKRLRELAKPRRQARGSDDCPANFDPYHWSALNKARATRTGLGAENSARNQSSSRF